MAFEDYVRDISYLLSGNLSDLTLNFGDKTWQIHKALTVCHSKWFQKALTSGFKETNSGGITLDDEPEYADAVDCMVLYFYEAGYNAHKYDTSEALLHAQVAILADKYDCASLYRLAKTSFAESIQVVESNEWREIAAFVYDFTTTEAQAHREIRNVVITTVASRCYMIGSTLQNETVVDLLRSNADLATDLLLGRRYGTMVQDMDVHHPGTIQSSARQVHQALT
ncbi:hypothetical protein T440DRAFT_493225 [Plenodomus tracheiphilus IPT5]|uniref:BTB domain-containing protein n=1 Tax=Plenodomus tracheiphilus IPT5 TaxID=1408161 RepID=A0A6A7AU44_9PLEO|nr:hypothetical protein T440DRAFT_493225 [Plenodomus tracheiphilus IPT5]